MAVCSNSEDRAYTTSNDLPDWVKTKGKEISDTADNLATRDYPLYTGSRIEGFSPDQMQGFQQVRDMQGAWKPYITGAQGTAGEVAGSDIAGGDLTPYMNQYQQLVGDEAIREVNRQGGQQRNMLKGRMQSANAFDSARHGVVEGDQMRNEIRTAGDIRNRVSADSYNTAMASKLAEDRNKLGGAQLQGELAKLAQQSGFADIASLLDSGGQQQGLGQANKNIAYQDFLGQYEHPMEMLNLRMQALGGVPYQTISKQIGPYDTPNTFAQMLGGTGALAGGLGMFAEGGGFSKLFG